jgi:hypothetical protein
MLMSACVQKSQIDDVHSFFMIKEIEDGFVNKYYVHSAPFKGQNSTDILYDEYLLRDNNQIVISTFNAGMELVEERVLEYDDRSLKMLSDKRISVSDTTDVNIITPDFLSFDHVPAELHLMGKIKNEIFFETHTRKDLAKDSIISGKRAVIFNEKTTFKESYNSDTTRAEVIGTITYLEGVGLFYVKKNFPDGSKILELVEQMPLSAFRKLKNHDLKRVGYIDPSKALDRSENFRLCFKDEMIHDYYNSSPDGRYIGGKKEMTKIITSKVQKDKLKNESGYLTFRFVVNCHGEAGRFVIEESSLDYEKKEFNNETVNHLFTILHQDLKKWRPVVIDGPKDAYFYITFKLRNGEIIEILP